MEFSYKESNKKFVKRMVATIYNFLTEPKNKDNKFIEKEYRIKIGAKTNNGFGKIKLNEDCTFYEFNFQEKNDVVNYLLNKRPQENIIQPDALGIPYKLKTNNTFSIKVNLKLNNSLIVKSYSANSSDPDSIHIKSKNKGNDEDILPGTSLKGAIRARAERILNTLGKSPQVAKDLFGYVDDENRSKTAIKSKIRINEVVLPKFIAELQTRIKIDRFTGGTIDSALFDSMPLFTDFNDKVFQVHIDIEDYKPHEAGLLLLVLKDLWSGDLAVGGEKNVGRGTFSGVSAVILENDMPVIKEKNLNSLSDDEQNILQEFVTALNKEVS